jgi:DNA-binding transcriptional regulator YhcF (GntR family)
MKQKIVINKNSQIPVYKQVINSVQDLVNTGKYGEGTLLPSMNELSNELGISKETVQKAYSILRKKRIIESVHGKGFYVTNKGDNKIKILLLFDKISTYKQVLYDSFAAKIGTTSEITIRLHNQDVELFDYFVRENLDYFDYYIITPHFPLQSECQRRVIKTLKKIPNWKLVLLDRNIEGLPGNFGSVYQDFENDIVDGLNQASDHLKKFNKLNIMSMQNSMYASLIEKGITRYCAEHQVKFEIYKNISLKQMKRHEAYIILNSQLDQGVIELIKLAKTNGCKIGEDIGIISYNESPINEIILDGLTVFSTDFKQMGDLAATMIIDKSFKKIKCDFKLIRRNTF